VTPPLGGELLLEVLEARQGVRGVAKAPREAHATRCMPCPSTQSPGVTPAAGKEAEVAQRARSRRTHRSYAVILLHNLKVFKFS